MPTLTIRNVSPKVVRELKSRARRNHCSMEQEVRNLLAQSMEERQSVLQQIEAAWSRQTRRPTPREVESWINAGRD
jgi:plasmid stability protein